MGCCGFGGSSDPVGYRRQVGDADLHGVESVLRGDHYCGIDPAPARGGTMKFVVKASRSRLRHPPRNPFLVPGFGPATITIVTLDIEAASEAEVRRLWKVGQKEGTCGAPARGRMADGEPRCCATCAFHPLGCRCEFGDPPDTVNDFPGHFALEEEEMDDCYD